MLEVLGYRVLLKPDEWNKKHKVEGTDIEIEIVHNEKEKKALRTTGVVVAIGPLAWADYNKNLGKHFNWVEPGDRVMYSRYGGKIVEDPDTHEEYLLVDDGDVLCKIVEDKNHG